MDPKSKNRDNYIDAVKGVGIISIVLGHACWNINIRGCILPVGPFVYLYHLAIFAFCAGYVYKSNEDSVWIYISKRLKSMYLPFIQYSIFYIVCRNIFIKIGVLEATSYTIGDTIIAFTNILTFNSCGELVGALWFVPMIFFAVVFYAFLEKSINKLNITILIKKVIMCIVMMLIGIVGLYTTEKQYGLLHNIQIAYLFVPIIWLGSLAKKIEIKKYCGLIIGIITFLIMSIVLYLNVGIIELSKFMIINKWIFYPITIIGILFCLSITKLFCKLGKIEKMLIVAGRNSFDIMALHFICFKLIDFIICKSIGKNDLLAVFPHSFNSIWIIYVLGGVGISIWVVNMKNKLKKIWRKIENRNRIQ